jgi:hypothetical protein
MFPDTSHDTPGDSDLGAPAASRQLAPPAGHPADPVQAPVLDERPIGTLIMMP